VPFLRRRDAAAQWATVRRTVDRCGLRHPALEFGLRWVEQHLPRPVEARVVHGDFRTGNLIVGGDGVRCVLDWELAVFGDPMQDLGWLCINAWRFGGAAPVGGFGSREQLFEGYRRSSGSGVDRERVRFWEAFGNVKWAIMCLSMGLGRGSADRPVGLEHLVIGRRVEEPLLDFLNLIEARD
jgi:aminoglycoside phosphotransferase (APT) family kinase protein